MASLPPRPKLASENLEKTSSMLEKYSYEPKKQPKLPERKENDVVNLSEKFGIKANEDKIQKKEEIKSRFIKIIFRFR
jgi:hypothetical protein